MTTTPPAARDQGAAVTTGFLGWTLDAFDFLLVVMTLTAIAKEFGKSDADIAASIGLTLAFRPVGAFIFGLLADRYGRKLPLMLDLVFYSAVEVLTGLAPNYATFMVLRALFGIGMGGEWGVGASLVMEKVPPRLRGVISGLLQQGYAAGYLLAALCYFFVFPHWGWRPLFFIGGDRKSTRLNSSHSQISYAVFCLKKKKKKIVNERLRRNKTIYLYNSTMSR